MASAVGFSFFTKPTSATWLTTGDLQSQQNRTTHSLNILFPFAHLPPPPPFPIYTDQPPKPNTAACHRKSATQTPTTTNPEIHKEAQIEKPTPKTHVNCFFFFFLLLLFYFHRCQLLNTLEENHRRQLQLSILYHAAAVLIL